MKGKPSLGDRAVQKRQKASESSRGKTGDTRTVLCICDKIETT
ncbi:hypothetical protein GCWU000246_01734 [Jonquetella anthropi E3_33 E1]|nr:hypothetical protein GCWU000246_01734 [Jonquetella anthropi E3_33 E1]